MTKMKTQLHALLILAVTLVLLVLLFVNNPSLMTVLAVVMVLVTLIMVIGGASRYLPAVLTAIKDIFTKRGL
jgi:hypothetical protein